MSRITVNICCAGIMLQQERTGSVEYRSSRNAVESRIEVDSQTLTKHLSREAIGTSPLMCVS